MSLMVEMEVHPALSDHEKEAVQTIKQALVETADMEELGIPSAEVSVVIVDDEEIHQLNRDFRNVDRPTDVLSFPQWESKEEWVTCKDSPLPLGDIVISLSRAREQSDTYGHSLKREVAFLAVHGFLHLLGYNHTTEEEEKIMFSRQEEVLSRIGLTR